MLNIFFDVEYFNLSILIPYKKDYCTVPQQNNNSKLNFSFIFKVLLVELVGFKVPPKTAV